MIRTIITIFSLSFATAWFLWSQLHWHYLSARNKELENRTQFFATSCEKTIKQNKKLNESNTYLAQQIYIFERERLGRKKYLAQLKKLIKKRNFKYGIGGR